MLESTVVRTDSHILTAHNREILFNRNRLEAHAVTMASGSLIGHLGKYFGGAGLREVQRLLLTGRDRGALWDLEWRCEAAGSRRL
jgi:hypothetical protein